MRIAKRKVYFPLKTGLDFRASEDSFLLTAELYAKRSESRLSAVSVSRRSRPLAAIRAWRSILIGETLVSDNRSMLICREVVGRDEACDPGSSLERDAAPQLTYFGYAIAAIKHSSFRQA
jgi:hypothetical protein